MEYIIVKSWTKAEDRKLSKSKKTAKALGEQLGRTASSVAGRRKRLQNPGADNAARQNRRLKDPEGNKATTAAWKKANRAKVAGYKQTNRANNAGSGKRSKKKWSTRELNVLKRGGTHAEMGRKTGRGAGAVARKLAADRKKLGK